MVMKKLKGVNMIKRYLGVSESSTMHAIFYKGLPAKKVDGEWEAKKTEIDKWLKKNG